MPSHRITRRPVMPVMAPIGPTLRVMSFMPLMTPNYIIGSHCDQMSNYTIAGTHTHTLSQSLPISHSLTLSVSLLLWFRRNAKNDVLPRIQFISLTTCQAFDRREANLIILLVWVRCVIGMRGSERCCLSLYRWWTDWLIARSSCGMSERLLRSGRSALHSLSHRYCCL